MIRYNLYKHLFTDMTKIIGGTTRARTISDPPPLSNPMIVPRERSKSLDDDYPIRFNIFNPGLTKKTLDSLPIDIQTRNGDHIFRALIAYLNRDFVALATHFRTYEADLSPTQPIITQQLNHDRNNRIINYYKFRKIWLGKQACAFIGHHGDLSTWLMGGDLLGFLNWLVYQTNAVPFNVTEEVAKQQLGSVIGYPPEIL